MRNFCRQCGDYVGDDSGICENSECSGNRCRGCPKLLDYINELEKSASDLAMLSIQSNRYKNDEDFRIVVDNVWGIIKRHKFYGKEVDRVVREES